MTNVLSGSILPRGTYDSGKTRKENTAFPSHESVTMLSSLCLPALGPLAVALHIAAHILDKKKF